MFFLGEKRVDAMLGCHGLTGELDGFLKGIINNINWVNKYDTIVPVHIALALSATGTVKRVAGRRSGLKSQLILSTWRFLLFFPSTSAVVSGVSRELDTIFPQNQRQRRGYLVSINRSVI